MSAPEPSNYAQRRRSRLARGQSRAANPRTTIKLNSADWLGFAPDLPDHIAGGRSWVEGTVGIRSQYIDPPRNTGGTGLTTDTGFRKVSTTLDSGGEVIRLQSMLLTDENGKIGADSAETDYQLTLIAATSGDGAGVGGGVAGSGKIYRINPAGAWTEITYKAHGTGGGAYPSAKQLSGGIDGVAWAEGMSDSAVFAAGAPSHSPYASNAASDAGTTSLNLPVMIYTNMVNPVYVYPAAPYSDGGSANGDRQKYTELHAGTLEPFYARCCFAWEGRMFYGDTRESSDSTQHPQRIRWSALYDASPDPSLPGSGYIDVRELHGRVLGYENLDPYLVVYYSDGIVFLERTNLSAAPIGYRVVTDHRGCLGTHSVAHISPREHFMIASDGFYILNASGEFREIGIIESGGVYFRKWHNYFFSNVDLSLAHRIQCHYDQVSKTVRITWPNKNTGKMVVWSYDIERDWMMPEGWSEQAAEVTCFADHNDTIRSAIAWDSADAPATWQDTTALGGTTWSSGSTLFGISNLYHGTAQGFVNSHDPTTNEFNGNPQEWALVTARQPTSDVRNTTVWESLDVEIVDLGNNSNISISMEVQDMLGSMVSDSSSQSMTVSGTNTGYIYLRHLYTRLSGAYASFKLSGTGPIGIKQILVDIRESLSRIR